MSISSDESEVNSNLYDPLNTATNLSLNLEESSGDIEVEAFVEHTEKDIDKQEVVNELIQTIRASSVILNLIKEKQKEKMAENEIAEPMKYSTLMNAKKQTLSSIAEHCFKVGSSAVETIIDIDKALKLNKINNESDEDHRVRILDSIKEIVEPKLDACRITLSENSTCKPLAKWLKKPIEESDADREAKNEKVSDPKVLPILEKGTPVFHGKKDEIISNWLFVIESKFTAMNISDKRKVDLVIPFLKDKALNAAINYVALNEGKNWEKFKSHLTRLFEPIDLQRRLRLKLMDLRQTGNIDDFNSTYLELCNRIESLSEDDKLLFYVEKLKPRVRYEVNAKNPEDLDEAMEYATNFENLTSDKPFAEVNKISSFNKTPVKCYYCGIMGHIASECRKKMKKTSFKGENSKTPNRTNVYKKQAGHKAEQKGEKHKIVKCYRCQLPGHIAKNCKVKSVNMIELNAMQLEFIPDDEISRKVPKETYAVADPFEVNCIDINPSSLFVEAKNYEKLIVIDVDLNLKNQEARASAVLDSASTVVSRLKLMSTERRNLENIPGKWPS